MRRLVPLILAAGTVASLGAAAPHVARFAHPDFSGTWNLDSAKSEGQMIPKSSTLKVSQTEKTMTVERTTTAAGITRTGTTTYALDGSPSRNTVTEGGMSVDFNSTAEWNGNVLVIKTTANIGPGFSGTERYSLSDDKKTLVIAGDATIGPQSMTGKQVFTKQ